MRGRNGWGSFFNGFVGEEGQNFLGGGVRCCVLVLIGGKRRGRFVFV